MEVLARVQAGGRAFSCGLAITEQERAAVLAQRLRVYQRHGYYRAGLGADCDVYDTKAEYFLAVLPAAELGDVLLGSARVIFGESRGGFRFPAEQACAFELPQAIAQTPMAQRVEVSRLVAEAVRGVVIGGLLTPLGLMQAISEYVRRRGARSGIAVIKQRLLRALQGAGVALHEIHPAAVIYPKDGPASAYFYSSDPAVPVYWLTNEIGPSVEHAIARYHGAGA
jgi:hypothetical protein